MADNVWLLAWGFWNPRKPPKYAHALILSFGAATLAVAHAHVELLSKNHA